MAALSDLQVLRDEADIKRLKALYFRSVDTKDWDTLEGLFTDDATLWFAEHEPEPLPFRESLERNIKGILEGAVSVHHGHMPEIEVLSEDRARGIWAMESRLSWPRGDSRIGLQYSHGYGHYHEEYRKVGGRWRIRSLKLTQLWKQAIPYPKAVF